MDNPLNILVLDFDKPVESRLCLESIKKHIKFPHKVVFLDNGSKEKYACDFKKEGLIDTLLISNVNQGLGIGTKELINSCDSEFFLYFQNDQILNNKIDELAMGYFTRILYDKRLDRNGDRFTIKSISLAGAVCGENIYSERAHIGNTAFYKFYLDKLPNGGAGPRHSEPWIEGAWQDIYRQNNFIHLTQFNLVIDNGKTAERQNPDGSRWRHTTDEKRLWLISGPVKEKYIYPYLNDSEWLSVLSTQSWPDGQIPEREIQSSFRVPQWH